ncbi:TPA: prophage tail fiber N-terminal domain-containing protein [Serratia odorifera]
MAVLISGKLIGPNGDPRPGVTIMLTAVKTSSAVVHLAPSSSTTGPDGSYSLSVEVGTHNVMIEAYGRPFEKVGQITVYSDSKPGTLNDFLTSPGQNELTPAIVAIVDDMRAAAAVYAQQAKEARDDAKASADAAQAGIDAYPTLAKAQEAVNSGAETREYIWVRSTVEGHVSDEYHNVNKVLTPTGVFTTSGNAVEKVANSLKDDKADLAAAIRDPNGFTEFEIEKGGAFGTTRVRVATDAIINEAFTIKTNAEGRFVVMDPQLFEFQAEDSPAAEFEPPKPPEPSNTLLERDNRNKLAAMFRKSKGVTYDIAGAIWDYCIILVYGQSLASAMEGWPALTKVAREIENLLMVGGSTRGNSRSGTYAPLGENIFQPLRAIVQGTNALELPDDQVAALAPGDTSEGEDSAVSAVHLWRALQLQLQGMTENPNRKIIVVNCAVAGRSVEQLSKGAPAQHYENRVLKALNNIKALVDAKSTEIGRTLTCGIAGCVYNGNQWNYLGKDGTTDKDGFKAVLGTLFDDISSENQAIFGVTERPFFITMQTGDNYTRDATNLSIGMAHVEMQNERDNVFLVGPEAFVPSKPGGHRDPNGYRWLGQQIGKVLHQVADRRLDWFPLHPISATYSGREVLADHMVWSPPLQWRETFSAINPTMFQNKGYRITDAVGDATIVNVEIAADTITRIVAERDLVSPVYVWYAGQTSYSGDGNLFDSDTTRALYNYEYREGTGQYAAANLPAYVDKPYPLNNASCAYRIEAVKND